MAGSGLNPFLRVPRRYAAAYLEAARPRRQGFPRRKVVAGSQLDHVAAVQAVPAVQIRIPCRAAVGDEIGAQGSSVLRQGTAHDLLHAPVM